MPDVKCDWWSCYWNDESSNKCKYDGYVYLIMAEEDNPTGDLLECEQYLYLSKSKKGKENED